MDNSEKVILEILRKITERCCEEQKEDEKCLHFNDKDYTYCDRSPKPLIMNCEESILQNRFSCPELEKRNDYMSDQSSTDHLIREFIYKNSPQEPSIKYQPISKNLEISSDMILPGELDVTQAQNKETDKLKSFLPKSESMDLPSMSDEFDKKIDTCVNEAMTPENILIVSQKFEEKFSEIIEKTTTESLSPENYLILSQKSEEKFEKTATSQKFEEKFNEIVEKTTTEILTPENILNVSQKSEEKLDAMIEENTTEILNPEKLRVLKQNDEKMEKITNEILTSQKSKEKMEKATADQMTPENILTVSQKSERKFDEMIEETSNEILTQERSKEQNDEKIGKFTDEILTSQKSKEKMETTREDQMTPKNILIVSQKSEEKFYEMIEKTAYEPATPENILIVSQKSDEHLLPFAMNVESRSERNIDLKVEQCINDYSAETPAPVRDQQIDIRPVDSGAGSGLIATCQINSKDYELTESEIMTVGSWQIKGNDYELTKSEIMTVDSWQINSKDYELTESEIMTVNRCHINSKDYELTESENMTVDSCQIKGKGYELTESDNMLVDEDGITQYAKEGLKRKLEEMQPLCSRDHGSQNIAFRQSNTGTEITGFCKYDEDDNPKSGQIESVDVNSRSINLREISAVDSQFKYICDEGGEDILEAHVNIKKLDLSGKQSDVDAFKDTHVKAELAIGTPKVIDSINNGEMDKICLYSPNNGEMGEKSLYYLNNEDMDTKSTNSADNADIIMESDKDVESIEVSQKLEIKLDPTLHEESKRSQENFVGNLSIDEESRSQGNCVGNPFMDEESGRIQRNYVSNPFIDEECRRSQRNCVRNSSIEEILVSTEDKNFVGKSSNDEEEFLDSESSQMDQISFQNDNLVPENVGKPTSTSLSFDSIESMPVLEAPVLEAPKDIISVNTSSISPQWCVDSDEDEDYEVYAPTQCFRPNVSADMVDLYEEDGPCKESDDGVCNLKVRKLEDDAVVPELVRVINEEDQTYSTYTETDPFKPKLHPLTGKQCFTWTPQIAEDKDYGHANGGSNDLTKSGCDFPGLSQLMACSRPIRLGLSKKQKTRRLHPYFQ